MNKMTLRTLPAMLMIAFSGAASAAAFQLSEQSASGIGNAYAGSAALADNASMVFYNPAGLTRLTGFQLSAGVAGIGPHYRFSDDGGSTGTGGDGGNAGSWAAVPNIHLAWQVTPDWYLGFGISSPFGMATEYQDNGWIGRYQSLKSEVKTVNYNPSIGYRLNDKISLGFGLNYQTLDAELSSMTLGDQLSRLKGDDSAWGWNAGVLFTLSPAMRLGLSYRSSVKYTLTGDASVGASSTPAQADIKLPDTFILSVWQQVSDRWEAMGDFSYTRWSSLKTLDVYSQNSGTLINSETFNYRNAWRLAWGAAYLVNDDFKFKFGVAYDRTPTVDEYRSARVPDNNRIWLSLGGQWNVGGKGRIDLGYSYLYLKDPSVQQTNGTVLSGSYKDRAHIVGLQYSTGF